MAIVKTIFLGCIALTLTAAAAPTTVPTTAPAAVTATALSAFGEWSERVNGLQARVATLGNPGYTDAVFLELRNSGEKPTTIPSLAISVSNKDFPWKLQIGQGDDWKSVPWDTRGFGTTGGTDKPKRESEQAVILQPGETALMRINSALDAEVRHAQQFRLSIQQSGIGPISGWSRTLNTPPASTHPSEKTMSRLAGTLAAPAYFPPFSRVATFFPNGSGYESAFRLLSATNWRLYEQLALYRDEPVAAELERRLAAENDFTMQLLLAVEAVGRGSIAGKQFILSAMKDLDYARCLSTLDALKDLSSRDNTPDWVLSAIITALQDQRRVVNLPSRWGKGTSFTVSDLADGDSDLAWVLGDKKCLRAVPVLIELTKNERHRRDAIDALGRIGDPAAIPTLFKTATTERANLKISGESLEPELYQMALGALVNLKAAGTEDELLNNVVHEEIVKMLEQTGDARAIPILRELVSTGKAKQIQGSNAKSDRSCVEAARIALATLEPGDPVPRYCALVQDRSLNEFTRREAIWRLGEQQHIDPRAIPVLLKAARDDPSGTVVDNAIIVLGAYRYTAAVDGLIELFHADFARKENWKYAYTPEMFREHIADSLEKLSGQSFGVDPIAWQKWWASQDQSAFK
jgi:HEAT repeat protein